MPSIFDRCRIEPHTLPNVENIFAHSADAASIAVKVAASAYAFTHVIDPCSEKAQEGHDIPFKSLKDYLKKGEGTSFAEWYGKEASPETTKSFAIAVSGGAAYGVLLNDILFIGFRGTTNRKDWSINLFGDWRSGPAKCSPVYSLNDYIKEYRFYYTRKIANEHSLGLHAGFYRVSTALAVSLEHEIKKIEKYYDDNQKNNNKMGIVLTGHSLGGALALLAGSFIKHNAVYTFGMPRVCNEFYISDLPSCHYRYILKGDIVPSFPPVLLGFMHDMPSLCLDPYYGIEKPSFFCKALRGLREGLNFYDSSQKAVKAILASEHDMELYVKTVIAQQTC